MHPGRFHHLDGSALDQTAGAHARALGAHADDAVRAWGVTIEATRQRWQATRDETAATKRVLSTARDARRDHEDSVRQILVGLGVRGLADLLLTAPGELATRIDALGGALRDAAPRVLEAMTTHATAMAGADVEERVAELRLGEARTQEDRAAEEVRRVLSSSVYVLRSLLTDVDAVDALFPSTVAP